MREAGRLAFRSSVGVCLGFWLALDPAVAFRSDPASLRARFGTGRHYVGAQAPGIACHVVIAPRPEWGLRAFWIVPWIDGFRREVYALSSLAVEVGADGSLRALDDRGNGACNDPEAMRSPSPRATVRYERGSSSVAVVRECGGAGSLIESRVRATFDSNYQLTSFRAQEWGGSLPWAPFPKSAVAEANCPVMRLEAEF